MAQETCGRANGGVTGKGASAAARWSEAIACALGRGLCVLWTVVAFGWSSAASASEHIDQVTLQLSWLHQATSGGFYVADQQGLYTREGIAVRFREGGPKIDPIAAVVDGQAEFGVTGAGELLVARQDGAPIRAIAVIFRRSPIVYVTKADSGIRRPQDFVGKTIRVSPADSISLLAMMGRLGIAPDSYRLVNLPSELDRFMADEADVWTFYVNGSLTVLQDSGQEINLIYPDDYGVHFYAETLFTTDQAIADQPDLVLRFLRASLQGWEIAVEQPSLVGELVRRYKPTADVARETLKMQATQALVNTGEDRIGWMREERWRDMTKVMQAYGVLAGPVEVREAFTLVFLEQVYGSIR